jgi:hypothetical protein
MYLNHPEFTFNGTVEFSVSVPGAGPVVYLVAKWNSTTASYQAIYETPLVSSPVAMTIRAEATDIKDRISTNSTTTYVVPATSSQPYTTPPSSLGIVELAIVAVLFLVPIFAYLIEKYRRK